jgi:asparagine N-glycosylation enzyme membrane subunit Stt3
MADDYVRVPIDSTGKKLRTNSRSVGADTVHEEMVIPVNRSTGDAQEIGATTPTIYTKEMTAANTEYSQALTNVKAFSMHVRTDDAAFRLAYETGKVAAPTEPYLSKASGLEHSIAGLNNANITLYFACVSAGKVMEIEAWT